jgi:F-type H+-transporting ATPase subunit b
MENLLQVLKLDATILPQFLIFLIAYLALSQLVFKPYLKAFDRRREATVGGKEIADQLILETQNIHYNYETKAREINTEINSIFANARKEATKLQDEIVLSARAESEKLLKKSREEISNHVSRTREELKKQVPEISQAISDRLLGKEVH